MKKIMMMFALVVGMMATVACSKWVEGSENGKLDGNWQLVAVDTIGGNTKDMQAERRFLAVQGSILQLNDANSGATYIFRFDYSDGKLSLSDARGNDRENGDPVLSDASPLMPFGINALTETFDIALDGSRMTLTGDHLVLHFRRF